MVNRTSWQCPRKWEVWIHCVNIVCHGRSSARVDMIPTCTAGSMVPILRKYRLQWFWRTQDSLCVYRTAWRGVASRLLLRQVTAWVGIYNYIYLACYVIGGLSCHCVLVIVIVCLRLVGQVFERVYLGHPLFSQSGHIRLFGLEAVLQWDEFCVCRRVSHMGLCETRQLR